MAKFTGSKADFLNPTLDLTGTVGYLIPAPFTTTERDALTNVPEAAVIYNSTTNKLNFYNGSAWEQVTSA